MKRILYGMFSFIAALAMTMTTFSNVLASYSPAQAPVYRQLNITNSTGWSFETSGTVEKITAATDGWTMQAGGNVADTHFARVKYKLPEMAGVVFTSFYAKAVIVFPADFYTQQKAGFRVLNTDNYKTTLNGTSVGSVNANELRVSVDIYNSDHKLRVLVDHELGTKLELYVAPTILSTGQHTFELAGDVAKSAPWYLKIDGKVVASGTQRLSPDDTVASERVVTRIVAGIDGAADQDASSMSLKVKNLEIANYDMAGTTATPVPATATLIATKAVTATAMPSLTATKPATATPTRVPPTITATKIISATATKIPSTPTASAVPVLPSATKITIPTTTLQPTSVPVTQIVSQGQIYKFLNINNSNGWNFETSGSVEKITTATDGWIMQAGGNTASTHFARVKYKLPEMAGVVFTSFYARTVINLPSDFYTQQKAGFRILSTDNYPTKLNGTSVGASSTNSDLRVSVTIYNSDHKLRVLVDHETGTKLELYVAPTILPTGEHTFELAGDVANNAPWYLKIDGKIVASGIKRLSTDDTAVSERVITRIISGIDGAADQDANSMNLKVKSLEIANYDISGVAIASVPENVTSISIAASTTVPSSPTATIASTNTLTPISITATASPLPILSINTAAPTVTSQPTQAPATPIVVSAGENSVDVRVSSGNDDVEESSSGKMSINSDDLELVYDNNAQIVGIRFTGVKIPQGATITNAYIQFKVDETSSKKIKLTLSGEANANASAFAGTTRNVSIRPRTSNKITWYPQSWSKVGETGTSQRTPNIKSIVQEVVNQPNWNAGNSLVIIITGSTGKRVAKSFEGDASGAPLLHIEFSMPAPAVVAASPTVTLTTVTIVTVVPPTTDTPLPTQIPSTPIIAATATQIIIPTDTAAPTDIPSSPTVELINPTDTPEPTVP